MRIKTEPGLLKAYQKLTDLRKAGVPQNNPKVVILIKAIANYEKLFPPRIEFDEQEIPFLTWGSGTIKVKIPY